MREDDIVSGLRIEDKMLRNRDAYLDIETTGLSCEYAGITVIGIYAVNGADDRFVQLVGI